MHSSTLISCCLPASPTLSTEMGLPIHPPVGYYLPPQCCPTSGRSPPPSQVMVKLENKELWEKFNSVGTEMILTKSGRRMFPEISISLSGLDPSTLYTLCAQAVPEGDTRYKWRDGVWSKSGRAEPAPPTHLYVHPESPAPGQRWMDRPVSFSKIRLTNNTLSQNGQIILQSMHRYYLRVYIIPTSNRGSHLEMVSSFSFPETSFIAVTSYQNPKLSLLKIEENPFAKGIKFFKNQQEFHGTGKRPCGTSYIGESSPEFKKFKESTDEKDSDTENNSKDGNDISRDKPKTLMEKQQLSEEKLEEPQQVSESSGWEQQSLPMTDERTNAIERKQASQEGCVTIMGDTKHYRLDEMAERTHRRPLNLDVMGSLSSVPWGIVAPKHPWFSSATLSPLKVAPYSTASCLMAQRVSHPAHYNILPFPSSVSQMPTDSYSNVFNMAPWSKLSPPFSGLHHHLFQQMYPPNFYLPTPPTYRDQIALQR